MSKNGKFNVLEDSMDIKDLAQAIAKDEARREALEERDDDDDKLDGSSSLNDLYKDNTISTVATSKIDSDISELDKIEIKMSSISESIGMSTTIPSKSVMSETFDDETDDGDISKRSLLEPLSKSIESGVFIDSFDVEKKLIIKEN